MTEDVGDIDYNIIEGFIFGLRPTPLLTCSEWSDANRFLSSEASAEPGRWDTARTPYLRKVLDCLSPTSPYEEVIVQKASQQGFSESGLNCIGTYMDISPCPIMYIMPTVNMAKGLSKSRLKPMIESCPSLTAKIRPARERDADNTVLEKSFPGGLLILTGANSAAELSSRPIRVLVMDEVDRYPLNVDNEGSPMELAKKRTITFGNRKIYILSTPTVTGASAIEDVIEDTDKQMYFVHLPCCGAEQTLKFEQLKWEEGKPETVRYQCEHCEEFVDERHKVHFLKERGYGGSAEWKATDPEKSNKERIGFIINGLYSPLGWLSWKKIAQEYDASKDDPIKLRTFTNTVLGVSFAEKSDAPPWENLYNRRENYKTGTVNNDVCFITAGVDVQRDRIEMEVVGWCPGKVSYSIEYIVLYGDTANSKVWQELTQCVDKMYVKEDGTVMPIRMTAVDSGNFTNTVYDYCRNFSSSKLIPIKGQDSQSVIVRSPSPVDISSNTGKKVGKLRVFNVGVSILKLELYGWLRQEKIEGGTPDGYCHFPMYNPEYFKGLTAERLEFKVVKGYKKYAWNKHYDRNEPLDCRIYARAAASVIGMDRLSPEQWLSLRAGYTQKVSIKPVNPAEKNEEKVQKKPENRRRHDDFWA